MPTNIHVTFVGTWSADAQKAFNAACDVWEATLDIRVPIAITTMYEPKLDFAGLCVPNGVKLEDTWYTSANADAVTGRDNQPGQADMDVFFNPHMPWYYGTDGVCPPDSLDFMSVALHEICHGLGFLSLAMPADPEMKAGAYSHQTAEMVEGGFHVKTSFTFPKLDGSPCIFMKYLLVPPGKAENRLANTDAYPNPSEALMKAYTSEKVYFQTPDKNINWIFSPTTFIPGSSMDHLANESSLMYYEADKGQVIHAVDDSTKVILHALGWGIHR